MISDKIEKEHTILTKKFSGEGSQLFFLINWVLYLRKLQRIYLRKLQRITTDDK